LNPKKIRKVKGAFKIFGTLLNEQISLLLDYLQVSIRAFGIEKLFNKIIAENFPNLSKDMDVHVREAYRVPNDQERSSPWLL
jgi:hypothetical protein